MKIFVTGFGLMASLVMTLMISQVAMAQDRAVDKAAILALETQLIPLLNPTTPDPNLPKARLTDRMKALNVPGVSIAFIEKGHVKWTRVYGVAVQGDQMPLNVQSLFQAASMSKPLAAVAALRLVEQHKLALDEDINTQLKSWQVPQSAWTAEKKITLRALLSHTAGLSVSGFPGYAEAEPLPSLIQILEGQGPANTAAIRSFETPGKYAYSGGGYTVAQLAMIEASGQTYPDLLEDLVLKPIGMTHSTFSQPLRPDKKRQAVSGHDSYSQPLKGGSHTYPEYAAAGLWTTPSDYARFLIALQKSYQGAPKAILPQDLAKAMMTPVDADYGLGVALGLWGGRPFFQHGGSNAGFRSTAIAFLDGNEEGLVVMTNSDNGSRLMGEIWITLFEAYHLGQRDVTSADSSRRAPNKAPSP